MVYSVHEQLRQHQALQVEAQAPKEQAPPRSIRESFSQEFAQGDEAAQVGIDLNGDGEPDIWFPSVEDAVANNRQAMIDHGQLSQADIGAKDPAALESALGRAQNYWYYEQDPFKAAAAIAHGIGQGQNIFDDGHKRTAYHTAREFLDQNGYEHLAAEDDPELARHLLGYAIANAVEAGETGPWHDEEGEEIIPRTLEDTAQMFKDRHDRWLYANGYGG